MFWHDRKVRKIKGGEFLKILITERLITNLPKGKEATILGKMSQLVADYVATNFDMSAMRHGVSIREIKNNRHGLRIFKFRVSKKDRILFTFDTQRIRPELRKSIIFLDYCKHDDQGLIGRSIGLNNQKYDVYLEDEEQFEQQVDLIYEGFDYDPNEAITRVVTVETMAKLLDNRDDKIIYYLNDEQFACLQSHEAPTFIFGSAGSGKTTINIYKAFLLVMQPIRVAYFTYSRDLVEDAVKLFHKIVSESVEYKLEELMPRIQFHHFNEFVANEVNLFQVVNYAEFYQWVISHHPTLLKQLDLEVYEIWKEIRGLIKGMIPKEWIVYEIPLSEIDLPPSTLDLIIRRNLAQIKENQLILSAQKLYEAKKDYLDPVTFQAVLLMHRYLDHYLIKHSMLTLDMYLQLDEQYCLYSKGQRELVYEIALAYENFLQNQGKLDENDLARILLQKLSQDQVSLFDFVIADEIQDLTEIQIYCLIRLTRNRNHVLFSGDINQTIRPTYFHTGRIESLLKTSNTHLSFVKHQLIKNYRSSKEIVDLANSVIDLRIQNLGLNKKNDYHELAIRASQSAIFYGNFRSTKDIIALLRDGIHRHYVAIVVPDEQEKLALEHLTQTRGAVFTVEEIKGIEKDYIICYNIISKHRSVWELILIKDVRYQQKYRYYFNLLYVALTRARHQLCFIEEEMPEVLFSLLEDHFLVMDEYNEADFKLTMKSSDNQFYKEGQLYERRGLYKQAIHAYQLSKLELAKNDLLRCQALIKNQLGHQIEAGYDLMKIKEYEQAASCFLQGQDFLNYLKALVYQGLPYEKMDLIFKNLNMDLLEFVYLQTPPVNWLHRFNKLYVLSLNRRMKTVDRITDQIHDLKDKIREKI